MQIDFDRLGEVIDGYGGQITAEDLYQAEKAIDWMESEIFSLREQNARLREALANVELILRGIPS